MAKKTRQRSFDDVLTMLGTQRFDVAPVQEGAHSSQRADAPGTPVRPTNAVQIRKCGCAAEIASADGGGVLVLSRPGWLLGGHIARLLDRGYQKFFKTPKLEVPATADQLRALHEFSEELKAVIGGEVLYNEALGTTSDRYQYDRVAGRE